LTVRWLADECVSAALVVGLRAAGHDVVYMADIAPSESDTAVLARARADDRLLLTEDKDFGDLVFRRGGGVLGLVLLRIEPALKVATPRLQAAIAHFGDGLFGRYTIVEAGRFRSRSLRRG
jgi:predicted nuclease of predicted toxin-antitoxin system